MCIFSNFLIKRFFILCHFDKDSKEKQPLINQQRKYDEQGLTTNLSDPIVVR